MQIKKIVAFGLAALMTLSLAACGGKSETGLQAIKDRGKLRVGTKVDVPYFGYLNPDTNEMEGMEVDVAKAIAKGILGDENAIEWVGVTPQTRGPLLDNGDADLIIATFTITDERKQSWNFSEPYFIDQIGFLVNKSLGATDITDLDGKTIGVAQAATTKDALQAKADELGIIFNFDEYGSYPELKSALTAGRIDAVSVDKSILYGYVDDDTEILEYGFNPQEYGIASKKDNTELADYVNTYVKDAKADGSLQAILDKWGLQTVEE